MHRFPNLLTDDLSEIRFILRSRVEQCSENARDSASEVSRVYWVEQRELARRLIDTISETIGE